VGWQFAPKIIPFKLSMSFPLLPIPIAADLFGQSIQWSDMVVVGLLVILEGLLSIDNALVLGLLAKRLPKHLRAKALSYGLIGAFVFRVIAIGTASFLLQWTIVKLIGGGYLVYIAVKHLMFESGEDEERYTLDEAGSPHLVDAKTGQDLDIERENIELEQRLPIGASLIADGNEVSSTSDKNEGPTCSTNFSMFSFWKMVLIIELTDIAFAVDSILAAMALAGSRQDKLWVVVTGGLLGVILMRFAAAVFIRLLDRFPRFEVSAYLLVAVIGLKLVTDWGCNSDWSFNNSPRSAKMLGSWHESFQEFELKRRDAAVAYEGWLRASWPLGIAAPHVEAEELGVPVRPPHLLDFHDFRRPESIIFWLTMFGCFGLGFLPSRNKQPAT
jgi:YkoY family integral membrane protein